MNPHKAVLAFLCFLCITPPPLAQAAELLSKFHPYISLKEQYSDNLNLTAANRQSDFYTTVQPGIKFSDMGKTAGVDLDYSLGAVFYSKNSNLNYIRHDASLDAKYMTSQRVNFYLKDSFIRSDDPREREYFTTTEDNKFVLARTTQRAIYWRNVLAPTVEYQFGPENRLGLNYRNNLYRTEAAFGQDSQENYLNPFISYWFDKQNGISLDYGFTRGEFERNPDLTGHQANARYTHRFSALTSAFVQYTHSLRTFDPPGVDYDIMEPVVGISHALSPVWSVSAQVGYFWQKPDRGPTNDGFSYKAEVRNTDPRTTYQLSLQGGYTEDFFTAENLGFNRYHRLTGSLTHRLDRRVTIGGFGSVERAEFDLPAHTDTILGIGARASYMPLKWLNLALEISHRDRQSDLAAFEYRENRAMFTITATY